MSNEQMDLLLEEQEEAADRLAGEAAEFERTKWLPANRPPAPPPHVSHPLKIDWLMTLPPQERETHPEPEVTVRIATEKEISLGAKRMGKLAADNEWGVAITYARGTSVDSRGRPNGLVDSIAVRMQHQPFGAVVSYERGEDGKWTSRSAFVWSTGSMPMSVGVNDVKEFLAAQGKVPDAWTEITEDGTVIEHPNWYDAIRIREAKKKMAAKATAASRPRKVREHA